MSTIKTPAEKKQSSVERDRRNRYGDNSKSSRKNIRRGKQRRHMDERRSVGEVLSRLKGSVQEDEATEVELKAKTRIAQSKSEGFKKCPDIPLGMVLDRKNAKKNSK